MARLPASLAMHVSPAEGCGCAACEGARLDRWANLSDAQRRAILALHPTSPRHVDDLLRAHVASRTLQSIMAATRQRPALAFQLDLRRPLLSSPYYSFVLLTRHGADLLVTVARVERVAR